MSVIIEPIKPLVGGKVTVDKAHLTDPDVVEAIRTALEERGVLVFPELNLTDDERLDVKGVAQTGHLYHIKAIGPDRALYGVKAISPTGQMRDIKGVQVDPEEVEAVMNGVKVAAHVKALPHATDGDADPIWNVKCVRPDGHVLGIKAVDKAGALHDVKAACGWR